MTIAINGENFGKVDFFDYVFDTFTEANYAINEDAEKRLFGELNILYAILDTYGWKAEYRRWVDGVVGVN